MQQQRDKLAAEKAEKAAQRVRDTEALREATLVLDRREADLNKRTVEINERDAESKTLRNVADADRKSAAAGREGAAQDRIELSRRLARIQELAAGG